MATLDGIKAKLITITYYQNDDSDLTFAVTDENDDPVDLSGDDLLMHVKKKRTDSTAKAVAVFSTAANTITGAGASDNEVTLSGSYDIDQDSYVYDLERTAIEETVMYGPFLVTGDVTRP